MEESVFRYTVSCSGSGGSLGVYGTRCVLLGKLVKRIKKTEIVAEEINPLCFGSKENHIGPTLLLLRDCTLGRVSLVSRSH